VYAYWSRIPFASVTVLDAEREVRQQVQVQQQIPPLRYGMTTKKAAVAATFWAMTTKGRYLLANDL
jgi:hypothetical protein